MLDENLAKGFMEIHPVLEISSADLICTLVEKDVVIFLPDYVTEATIQRGTIMRLNVKDFEIELWKQLLYHCDKWVSPQMEATVGWLSTFLLN